jgi:hypothetical protein
MFARPLFAFGRRLTSLSRQHCQQNLDIMRLVQRKLAQVSDEYNLLDKKLADGKSTNPGSDRKHLNKLSSLVVLHEKVDACYKVPLP